MAVAAVLASTPEAANMASIAADCSIVKPAAFAAGAILVSAAWVSVTLAPYFCCIISIMSIAPTCWSAVRSQASPRSSIAATASVGAWPVTLA